MTVAAEEFEYPVEGFKDTHEEDDDNDVVRYPMSVIQKIPPEENEKEPRQGKPLEELDLRSKGKQGKGDTWGLRFEVRGLRTSDCRVRIEV